MKYSVCFFMILILTGCNEVRTSDPEEVYARWADGSAPNGIELLKGEYWQSAHWTKEYVMYLKLRPTNDWWKKFREINDLDRQRIDEVGVSKAEIFKIDSPDWIEKPDWFTPDKNSEVYGGFGGSKYFWDPESGILFMYEIQL